MSTIVNKSFTAVGAGEAFSIEPGQSLNYSLSGTFAAVVVFECSRNGGASWELVASATDAAMSGTVKNETRGQERYRVRCSAYTSGTAVTALSEVVGTTGGKLLSIAAAGQAKAGTTSGWVAAAADNTALVTCPASQTASTLVVPIPRLKVGDKIVGFNLVGQIESAGGIATVDAALRKMTAAAADVADAAVASMTQLSVTADAIMSASNTRKTGFEETVGEDETFYMLITATTAAATDIALQAVVLEIVEAP